MKIHPYMVAGIGRKYWITYSIRDGNAEIKAFPGGRKSIPLMEATIEREKSLKALLGLGTIKIISVSGSVQEWADVPNVDRVYKALVRASKGQSPEPTPEELELASEELRLAKKAPPLNIIFGEQVAFIPVIPRFFDIPLWKQTCISSFGTPYFRFDSWVNQGEAICGFGIYKHDPACWSCMSTFRKTLRLIDVEKHGTLGISIYSPVSGWVLRSYNSFDGNYTDDLNDGQTGCFMYVILLPKGASIPETMENSVAEFCRLCSQYRQSIFRNDQVRSMAVTGDGSLEEARQIWSDERIDETLADFRKRKIIVRPLSSLSFGEEIEKLKQSYPANFQ